MRYINKKENELYTKFIDFLNVEIGNKLVSKTKRLHSKCMIYSIPKNQFPNLMKLLKKYNIERYALFKDDKENYIKLKYVRQNFEGDLEKSNLNSELGQQISSLQDHMHTSMEPLKGQVKEYFRDYLIENPRFSYFILDARNETEAKNIIIHIKETINDVFYCDSKSIEFEIDSLVCFKVETSYLDDRNYIYEIRCMLSDSGIDYCIYYDKDGKIDTDSPFIDIKKPDKRKSKTGFRKDLEIVLDSSWEANVARILKKLGIPYEFEKQSFWIESKDFSQYYFPDFFISDNKIIEIKGFWDNESLKKVSLFKEQYQDFQLYIIDSDMYYTLANIYSQQIEDWEDSQIKLKKENLYVVGINRPERKQFVKALIEDEDVYLKRDYNNEYDINAIKVVDKHQNMIGFIRKDWAAIYAEKLDLGMKYNAKVKKIENSAVVIQIERVNCDEIIIYDFLRP